MQPIAGGGIPPALLRPSSFSPRSVTHPRLTAPIHYRRVCHAAHSESWREPDAALQQQRCHSSCELSAFMRVPRPAWLTYFSRHPLRPSIIMAAAVFFWPGGQTNASSGVGSQLAVPQSIDQSFSELYVASILLPLRPVRGEDEQASATMTGQR